MTSAPTTLPVLPMPGLRADSLGHYLAALGLLRAAARRWPDIRAAWRNGIFCLVGGPNGIEALIEHIVEVGRSGDWTPYTQQWKDAREAARTQKSSRGPAGPSPLAVWQAQAPENGAELALAHTVVTNAVYDNPLLGSGGSASKRNFAAGWREAVEAIRNAEGAGRSQAEYRDRVEADLAHFLLGEACYVLGGWNAASWFSQANKLYNFDAKRPVIEKGEITPWAMVLACEGLVMFAGSPSRRLGARARGRGAFPFAVDAAAPVKADGRQRDTGEMWLPVWQRPMTAPEVRFLYSRGRAELHGRGAVAPAAFAAAIMRRGIDAGIDAFSRFSLGQTTNPDMFEAQHRGIIHVPSPRSKGTASFGIDVAGIVADFVDGLPTDWQTRDRGRYERAGLRGPVEQALTEFAKTPDSSEVAVQLLDAVAVALDRVDRHHDHRQRGVRWRLLPVGWLAQLLQGVAPREVRLAMGLAAVGAGRHAARPLAYNRWGVDLHVRGDAERYLQFPPTAPASRVPAASSIDDWLARVLRRRLVDAGRDAAEGPSALPFAASVTLNCADVSAWLAGDADARLIARWLDRLLLFDWRFVPDHVGRMTRVNDGLQVSGLPLLYGLLRPLLDSRDLPATDGRPLLPTVSGARTVASAGRMIALLAAGQVDATMKSAAVRYRMAGRPLAEFASPWGGLDRPALQRLVSGLLLQPDARQVVRLATAWMRPQPSEGEER